MSGRINPWFYINGFPQLPHPYRQETKSKSFLLLLSFPVGCTTELDRALLLSLYRRTPTVSKCLRMACSNRVSRGRMRYWLMKVPLASPSLAVDPTAALGPEMMEGKGESQEEKGGVKESPMGARQIKGARKTTSLQECSIAYEALARIFLCVIDFRINFFPQTHKSLLPSLLSSRSRSLQTLPVVAQVQCQCPPNVGQCQNPPMSSLSLPWLLFHLSLVFFWLK